MEKYSVFSETYGFFSIWLMWRILEREEEATISGSPRNFIRVIKMTGVGIGNKEGHCKDWRIRNSVSNILNKIFFSLRDTKFCPSLFDTKLTESSKLLKTRRKALWSWKKPKSFKILSVCRTHSRAAAPGVRQLMHAKTVQPYFPHQTH